MAVARARTMDLGWTGGVRLECTTEPMGMSCGRAVAAAADPVQADTHTLRELPVCLADGDLPAASQ